MLHWESDLDHLFNAPFVDACVGRRFFVTKKGYIGTRPPELQQGDEIYILAGGKVPFVLQPLSKPQPNTFELVSDCYVHGIMDGEAVSEKAPERNRWRNLVAKGIAVASRQKVDPDLPLRDFHDVFIV